MENRRINDLTACVLIVGIGLLYFLFRPLIPADSDDNLDYVLSIMGYPDDYWFNPHHLAFEPMHSAIYKFTQLLGSGVDLMTIMQAVTILFSMAALFGVYKITRLLSFSLFYSLASVLCTAFSYGFWLYAATADTYVPAITFCVFTVYYYLKSVQSNYATSDLILTGLMIAAATLLQQHYVFLLPCVVIAMLMGWVFTKVRSTFFRLVKGLFIICFVSGVIIGTGYLGVSFFILDHDNIMQSIAWSKGHAEDGMWTDFSWWQSPVKAVIGLTRAFWGESFLSVSTVITDSIRAVTGTSVAKENFMVSDGVSPLKSISLFGAILIGNGALLVMLLSKVKNRAGFSRSNDAEGNPLSSAYKFFILPFILVFGLAALFWEPSNMEFHLQFIPLVFVLLFLFVQKLPSQTFHKISSLLLAASLFILTFAGGITYYTDENNSYWNYANEAINDMVQPGDLVVIDCNYKCRLNIRYNTLSGTLDRPLENASHLLFINYDTGSDVEYVNKLMTSHKDGRIFISKWIFHLSEANTNQESDPRYAKDREAWYAQLSDNLVDIKPLALKNGWERHEFYEYKP